MKKNIYLEFIRGAAALLVLITHIVILNPTLNKLGLNVISNWGTESVMIFFILSGLVINLSQTSNPKKTAGFILNRLIRLYPQFLIGFILGIAALVILKLPIPNFKILFGNVCMVSTLQGYLVTTLHSNGPIWSLTFEMFFYLVFALSIGKKQQVFLLGWLICSLLILPFYYSDIHNSILQHLISMFSFSPIWLLGYFIYQYKHLFYVDIYTALISVSLLPLVSRLHFSDFIYDPLKFLLFAFISFPFFRYALQGKNEGKKFTLFLMGVIYLLMIVLLWYNSDAQKVSKFFYTSLPILSVLVYFVIKKLNQIDYLKKVIHSFGKILGKYSYAIYIVHFPIMMVLANTITNVYLFCLSVFVSLYLIATFLENYFQKFMVHAYKKHF
jgi:peptidoglycan/LPS O-acetylase OafA/YrhL